MNERPLPSAEKTTQAQFPTRASLRTVLSTVIALAAVTPFVIIAIGDGVPGWLVPVLAGTAGIAGVINRIVLIPQVNDWLTRHGIGPVPKKEIQ